MRTRYPTAQLIVVCGIFLTAAAQTGSIDPAYQQSFDKWKSELVESRQKNWIPLAGLFWLKPGENTFGTDPKNGVVFPKGPANAGTFELSGNDVMLKLSPGTQAIIQGKSIT